MSLATSVAVISTAKSAVIRMRVSMLRAVATGQSSAPLRCAGEAAPAWPLRCSDNVSNHLFCRLAFPMTPPRRSRSAFLPRKRPRQERSRFTVEAILEAAAEILVRDGYEKLTTNRIADRAGVN